MGVIARGESSINLRYRPMRFSELVGNEKTKASLTKWMERGAKRNRAVLLSGESGGGKTTTARILAMGLNCELGDTVEPCLECPSCKAAMDGTAFHIVELNASEMNTKELTEEVVASMNEPCMMGRTKVYIFDEAQKLTDASQQLLLKPVEEPPPGVVVVFCTTDPQKLTPALRKRCEIYDYGLPNDKDVSILLASVVKQEGIEMSPEQKVAFFNAVRGRSYREILIALEQYSATMEVDGIGNVLVNADAKLNEVAFAVLFKGDFDAYKNAVEESAKNGTKMDFEALRRIMRTMASNQVKKHGFANMEKAALFWDILDQCDEKIFSDPQGEPSATRLVWKVCATVKGF